MNFSRSDNGTAGILCAPARLGNRFRRRRCRSAVFGPGVSRSHTMVFAIQTGKVSKMSTRLQTRDSTGFAAVNAAFHGIFHAAAFIFDSAHCLRCDSNLAAIIGIVERAT